MLSEMKPSSKLSFLTGSNGSDLSLRVVNAIEDSSDFKSSSVFTILDQALKEDSEGAIEKARGIYGFKVKNKQGKEGLWIVNAKIGKGSVTFNGKDKPDVTFEMSDDDMLDLLFGKMNPQKAYFQGKVKIKGNMGLAMKLTALLKQVSTKLDVLKSKL